MSQFSIFSFLLINIFSLFLIPNATLSKPLNTSFLKKEIKTTDDLLNKTCNFLQNQSLFSVNLDITYDNVLESGDKVQYSAYQKVWVNKPNQLRSDYIGDQRNTNFYYDGNTFTLFNPKLNLYGRENAPSNLDEALNQIQEEYGITIPMYNLFISNPCEQIKSEIQKSVYLGSNLVNRTLTHHILLIGETRNIQLWISFEEQPLLLKGIITYKKLPESPQYTVVFSNWNFKPEITDNTFIFNPPDNSSRIDFLPSIPQNN